MDFVGHRGWKLKDGVDLRGVDERRQRRVLVGDERVLVVVELIISSDIVDVAVVQVLRFDRAILVLAVEGDVEPAGGVAGEVHELNLMDDRKVGRRRCGVRLWQPLQEAENGGVDRSHGRLQHSVWRLELAVGSVGDGGGGGELPPRCLVVLVWRPHTVVWIVRIPAPRTNGNR